MGRGGVGFRGRVLAGRRVGAAVRGAQGVFLALALAAVVVGVAGCGAGDDGRREVLVAAASSLGGAFTEMAAEFERAHPGVEVTLNLAGSGLLREQILAGAPADVFAPADLSVMEAVAGAGLLAGESRVFARNRLTVAVPDGNPAGVTGLSDLARPELLIGLCDPAVPCGEYARQALEAAGTTAAADTREPNVRALLTKIAAGELDAGIVYATDAAAEQGVEAVKIPDGFNRTAEYPIAVVRGASHPAEAEAFAEFVLSEAGRRLLAGHGFLLP